MTILYILGAFILGCFVMHMAHKHADGNMSLERYLMCVQVALSNPKATDVQQMRVVLDEIGEYALGWEPFEELSPEAQEIVNLTPRSGV